MTSLRLKLATIDDAVTQAARGGVEQYLRAIDYYRAGQTPALPISGRFLDAVSAGLKDSATPGVTRQFSLTSLRVDYHVQKPWGTHAYADVTVTIVDRVVSGAGQDQYETGKLRLTGDRFWVTDGWDEANGRWFNGFGPLPLEQIRTGVVDPIAFYLRWQTWAPGLALDQWRAAGDESTPFGRALAERTAAEQKRSAAQSFEGTVATIERFETIDGLWSGLATVRLSATRVTTNSSGAVQRTPFEKRVRVFVFGSWMPEVVDEETLPGVWLSGGELALEKIDVNRA